jgi:hypothetical protein
MTPTDAVDSDVELTAPDALHDPVYHQAHRFVQQLITGTLPPAAKVVRPPTWWERWWRLGTRWSRLGQFAACAADVSAQRTNRGALVRLGRCLIDLGYPNLGTVVFRQVLRLHPQDREVPAVLARLYLHRAQRVDRTTTARLADFSRAFRFANHALRYAPQDRDLANVRLLASTDATLLKGQYAEAIG